VELDRSAETLKLCAASFTEHGVKVAIEPIRAAEVSFVHTIEDAMQYIRAVNHPPASHTSTAMCITCNPRRATSARR
jgi:D-psicose/D-tagatose/L-ribulose 3-epimerase